MRRLGLLRHVRRTCGARPLRPFYCVLNALQRGGPQELFSKVGRVKSARCLYDNRGRNLGEAEVEYFRAEDAEAARRKYNNVTLDGRPMKILIVGGVVVPRANVMDRISATGQRQRVAPARCVLQRGSKWSEEGRPLMMHVSRAAAAVRGVGLHSGEAADEGGAGVGRRRRRRSSTRSSTNTWT
jgi:hypothetical protein